MTTDASARIIRHLQKLSVIALHSHKDLFEKKGWGFHHFPVMAPPDASGTFQFDGG